MEPNVKKIFIIKSKLFHWDHDLFYKNGMKGYHFFAWVDKL